MQPTAQRRPVTRDVNSAAQAAFLVLPTILSLLLSFGADRIEATTQANPRLEDFEGIWLVQPNRQMRRMSGAGQRPPRGVGVPADDNGVTFADRMVRRMMTPAGQAAFDRFDPSEHPANNCRSPGLPSIAMTPYLQEWRVNEDGNLVITHEYFSTTRTIHMGQRPPKDSARTELGYATGQLKANELVIVTSALTPALGALSRNAPGSDARKVTERYRLGEDDDTMDGQLLIEDPKYLRRGISLSMSLGRTAHELTLFPCDAEAARRHLD